MVWRIECRREDLQLWREFRNSLSEHAGDSDYNQVIRENGFGVKSMSFDKDKIFFSIVTTHLISIPYNILAGGYESCMKFIDDKLDCLARVKDCLD